MYDITLVYFTLVEQLLSLDYLLICVYQINNECR